MGNVPKDAKIPIKNLVDLIVKDYCDYLATNTTGIELESLVEFHIRKHVEKPTEQTVQQIMNSVILKIRQKINGRKK